MTTAAANNTVPAETREAVETVLRAYCRAAGDVVNALREAEAERIQAESPATKGIGDGMPHAHGGRRGLDETVIRLGDMEDKVSAAVTTAELTRARIEDLMEKARLTAEETAVIRRRYLTIEGLAPVMYRTADGTPRLTGYQIGPWGPTARALGMTYAATTHAHHRAVEKLGRLPEIAERGAEI
jgi:hypothetical protein